MARHTKKVLFITIGVITIAVVGSILALRLNIKVIKPQSRRPHPLLWEWMSDQRRMGIRSFSGFLVISAEGRQRAEKGSDVVTMRR